MLLRETVAITTLFLFTAAFAGLLVEPEFIPPAAVIFVMMTVVYLIIIIPLVAIRYVESRSLFG